MKKKPTAAQVKKRLTPNKPVKSYKKDKKYMVLVKSGKSTKLIHFGASGYGHNYSDSARRAFRSRMGCDTDKPKKTTAKYWSCEYLWKKGSRKLTTGKKGGVSKKK